MQFNQLKYVLKASEFNNFSLAAKACFVSQPTLSQQIINLENEIGIKLFVRHSKSVSLTPAGEEFILYAQRIINDLDNLNSIINDYKSLSRGKLKIGVLWIIGYLSLSEQISDFSMNNPNIDVIVKVNGSNNLLDMLISREVDVAFLIGSNSLSTDTSLYCKKIIDDEFVVIVSNKNPLSKKKSITISDLKNEKIIMPSIDSILRKQIMSLFELEGINPNIICESSQSDVSVQLASQNFGVAFSSGSIANSLYDGKFTSVILIPKIKRPIYYVTLKDMLDYPTITQFTKYISELYYDL